MNYFPKFRRYIAPSVYPTILLFTTCVVLRSSAQVDTVSNLSQEEKIYGLSKFWSEASYNFVYFERTGINWDSVYETFIPKVIHTKNTWQYYQVLKKFAALLKDGHTSIQEPRNLYIASICKWIYIENSQHHFFVTNIGRQDSNKVPIGSELLKVNGIPVNAYVKKYLFPIIAASDDQELWNGAARMMFYGTDTTDRWHLILKTPSQQIIPYDAAFHTYKNDWEIEFPSWKRTEFKIIHDIGYFKINTFQDNGVIEDFKNALPKLRACKGIVIDLRENSGGNSAIGAEILKYFTRSNLIGSRWQSRENIGAYRAWGAALAKEKTTSLSPFDSICVKDYRNNYWYSGHTMQFKNDIQVKRINSPLVVLTSNHTASAAEDFLIMLKMLGKRAVTIGQTTSGSTGQPLVFALPGGGTGRVCAKKDTYPDGKEFVGYGIKPDILIERNIADVIEGKDRGLAYAIEFINEKLSGN